MWKLKLGANLEFAAQIQKVRLGTRNPRSAPGITSYKMNKAFPICNTARDQHGLMSPLRVKRVYNKRMFLYHNNLFLQMSYGSQQLSQGIIVHVLEMTSSGTNRKYIITESKMELISQVWRDNYEPAKAQFIILERS